jgi:hypothetical protein
MYIESENKLTQTQNWVWPTFKKNVMLPSPGSNRKSSKQEAEKYGNNIAT